MVCLGSIAAIERHDLNDRDASAVNLHEAKLNAPSVAIAAIRALPSKYSPGKAGGFRL
jgi:hypothetical protein